MKKNLMSVIILALVFANFVLTALLMFTVLPETKKANKMIEDVCNAVDLELNSGAATGLSNTSIDKIKAYTVNGGEKMTMSFANGDDNKQHFLVATISLSMNTESENFKTYGESIAEKDSIIKSSITDIVHKYTMDEFEEKRSRFLCAAVPVKTEKEAAAFVKEMQSVIFKSKKGDFDAQ